MHGLSIVIAQRDPAAANQLAHEFRLRAQQVVVTQSPAQVRDLIRSSHARAAIVDLELLKPEAFHDLCQHLRGTAIVATHRSPDEQMWMESMACGAVDCCQSNDVEGMLRAIAQNVKLARAHAA